MSNIKIVEAQVEPLCPHCEKKIDTILKVTHGSFERHTIYVCPHCQKILSVGNDTGFGT